MKLRRRKPIVRVISQYDYAYSVLSLSQNINTTIKVAQNLSLVNVYYLC